jgi:hypothetical protein
MSSVEWKPVQLSKAIESPLLAFRSALRRTKLWEAIFASLFFFVVAYWFVFIVERFYETHAWLRTFALCLGSLCCLLAIPWTVHKWIWGTRRLTEVARKLRPVFPRLSEQILSVVELSTSREIQTGSPVLISAAMQQVEKRIAGMDLLEGISKPRHRQWMIATLFLFAIVVMVSALYPSLAWNVWLRFSQPWLATPRYTFTRLVKLPSETVVAYAEPFELTMQVDKTSSNSPATARGWLHADGGKTVAFDANSHANAEKHDSSFTFQVPGQTDPAELTIQCGDAFAKTRIVPMARPELASAKANVTLPPYLQYDKPIVLDMRSGTATILQGSDVELTMRGARPLQTATWDGEELPIVDAGIRIPKQRIDESINMSLDWRDVHGLKAAAPMQIRLRAANDRSPSVACSKLPDAPVWLATDTLCFDVSAEDDYGLKHIGIEWVGVKDSTSDTNPIRGERMVVAGSSQQKQLGGGATFSCETEKVPPQLLQIRAFTEDYLPGRARVYSVPYLIQMMSPEEHSQWLSQQLRRWRGRADAIYDEELRLFEDNRELRSLNSAGESLEVTKDRIRKQSSDERANAQKLGAAVEEGHRLLEQALRNEEIRSQQIESWARALARLNQIADTRMPIVADQLQRAADAAQGNTALGNAGESKPPSFQDQQVSPVTPKPSEESSDSAPSGGRLTVPETVLGSDGQKQKPSEPKKDSPSEKQNKPLEEAVRDQTELIEEFRKAREQFDELMSDFENSTFIKRFKAASRMEREIASKVNSMIGRTFGKKPSNLEPWEKETTDLLRSQLDAASDFVRALQSDLTAYQNDVPSNNREAVLKEMTERNVLVKLSEMPERMDRNLRGDVLHRSEFWADTMDRWAEELAGPAKPGSGGGGGKVKESLPPALLLEIMRIIGDEIDLRNETRTLDQLIGKSERTLDTSDGLKDRATGLAVQQMGIQERTLNVSQDIRALPNAMKNFDKELSKLKKGVQAMDEASALLTDLKVGAHTNAAQTAAIEALLEARRGGGGGSGGGDDGGGSMASGTTRRLPMDMIGPGRDAGAKIAPRQVGEGVGKTGRQLPEEFREGLDSIFNELSRLKSQ